jgi:hypothetical protein
MTSGRLHALLVLINGTFGLFSYLKEALIARHDLATCGTKLLLEIKAKQGTYASAARGWCFQV